MMRGFVMINDSLIDSIFQVKPKKFIPKQEKVDDIKLAKELLKRRKGERAVSPAPPKSPEPEVEKTKIPVEPKGRGRAPKQEKVDDIKLAKELLRRRKQEAALVNKSPEAKSPEPEKPLPVPIPKEDIKEKVENNVENFKVEKKVGKLSGNEWNQEKKQLGSAPKAKKVDDLDMARQLLRRRKKSDDRMEQHIKTKTEGEPAEGERDLTNREKELVAPEMKQRSLPGHFITKANDGAEGAEGKSYQNLHIYIADSDYKHLCALISYFLERGFCISSLKSVYVMFVSKLGRFYTS